MAMMIHHSFTALLQREDNGWLALCPELDIASQGDSIEQAKAHLREAVELFLETASPMEVQQRLKGDTFISSLEVRVG
ncbi:MAG: type II toxin-antitoxin system HicB family antitoxin [Phycisphaerales bacterium]